MFQSLCWIFLPLLVLKILKRPTTFVGVVCSHRAKAKTPTNELRQSPLRTFINSGNAKGNPNYLFLFHKTKPMSIYIPPVRYTFLLLQDSNGYNPVSE